MGRGRRTLFRRRDALVLIQCTGLFESGDALRNIVHDWKLPIFSMIGYRSYLNQSTLPGDTSLVFTEPRARRVEDRLQADHGSVTDWRDSRPLPRVQSGEQTRMRTDCGGQSVSARMPVADAVALVHSLRRDDDVVVSSMGNAREWMALGPLHDRDLVLVPSAMGHATSIGLGLALAQPSRRIVVLSGDGSLLMNLGTLVTISAESPANLIVVVYDNGVYEVTGAQPTPGTERARARRRDRFHGDGARVRMDIGISLVGARRLAPRRQRRARRERSDAVVLDGSRRSTGPGQNRPGRERNVRSGLSPRYSVSSELQSPRESTSPACDSTAHHRIHFLTPRRDDCRGCVHPDATRCASCETRCPRRSC